MRRAYVVLLVVCASAFAACIIGPKQDDPADLEVLPGLDAGATVSDTAPASDTGSGAADTETPPFSGDGDAAADGDASEVRDGDASEVSDSDASDSVTEGG